MAQESNPAETQEMQRIECGGEICRVDEALREVEGYLYVTPKVGQWDLLRSTMETAWADYSLWGNLREMHDAKSACGTLIRGEWDDKGCKATFKIADEAAWAKVKQGVYKGFSVGVVPKEVRGEQVLRCDWVETSLVDRPADGKARITLHRRAEGREGGMTCENPAPVAPSETKDAPPATPTPTPSALELMASMVTRLEEMQATIERVDARNESLEKELRGYVERTQREDEERVTLAGRLNRRGDGEVHKVAAVERAFLANDSAKPPVAALLTRRYQELVAAPRAATYEEQRKQALQIGELKTQLSQLGIAV